MSERQHPGINLTHARPQDARHAEVTVFGFWTFLMSDAILFALLFATYASMVSRTAGGPSGAELFDIGNAFLETIVLLLSSFTFGMAAVALKEGRQRAASLWLVVTLLLGLGFLGLELREFSSLITQGATPQTSGFLSSFFVLLSLHGLHALVGCIWIGVMLAQIAIFGLSRPVRSRLLRLGLFWHFLDLVWIVIFTLVYLPVVSA
ncbi:cytochrome bo3 quinol oxidase subunit 3 [Devosia sp. YR412]|uniref:cytochrome c oxidase subunit 3 n=1 Tax=Devosia sp. YR412 TaxID=1881030 RepID=UPI0008B01CB4|nr:cytochrome c oxidase subunit 3 [Devosia sp. YR412]SEQ41685.1 cytochrome bo3 quinol oxidase subunit 3 [Devosia sp. YR412]